MTRVFGDSNVFLRFFTHDDRGQHSRAAELFKKAANGTLLLLTGPPVLFEIAWTLRAAYKLRGEQILDVLSRILTLPGLHMADAALAEEALRLARLTKLEFADAYIAASARASGAEAVATFNRRDFQRLGSALYGF